MITIHRSHGDDPGFLDQVEWIVTDRVDQYKPAELYVIRIRDWFDYKWCYFSGKAVGAVGVKKFCDLTLPPFVPNRVIAQEHYDRVATNNDNYELSNAPRLHIATNGGILHSTVIRIMKTKTKNPTAVRETTAKRLASRAAQADQIAKTARLQARQAKREMKAARKTFKHAKMAAKQARRKAKDAAKKLKLQGRSRGPMK